MSFADVLTQHASRVFLNTAHFGRALTRWPCGVEADAATVNAIFEPDRHGDRESTQQQDRTMFFGTLYVLESQTVEKADAWVIDDEVYYVDRLGKPDEGMREIRLKRVEKNTTSRTGNVR